MGIKRILANGLHMAVAAVCALAMSGIGDVTVSAALADGTPPPTVAAPQSDVGIFAFQHTWNTVASECEKTYGPAGVGWVQISPPHESITGTEWWTVYQAVSYRLESRFGTEAELRSMIQRCSAVGVAVAADVVINHTTGHNISWVNDQYGVAGSRYNGSYGRYPTMGADGIYMYEEGTNDHAYGVATGDFHSCKKDVSDWTSTQEVQECRLTTMWDLNTGSDHVREAQADYLFRLWQIGVRAFRVDSAKHIAATDIKALKDAVIEKINSANPDADPLTDIPLVQEVITHQGEASGIQPDQYTGNGRVLEFEYAYRLRQMFNGAIADLEHITDGLVGSDYSTVFVENWDTARESSETLNSRSGAQYEMANAFMLAHGYGQPRIMSDYYVEDVNAGPVGTTDTSTPDVDMDAACAATGIGDTGSWSQGDWLCQPRWTSIRGMVQFHNAVGEAPLANWQHRGDHVIAFDRGTRGFFAMNNLLHPQQATFATELPVGTYCNVYSGSCKQPVEVTEGADGKRTVTVTIPARSVVALDVDALAGSWQGIDGIDPGYEDTLDTSVIGADTTRVYYHAAAAGEPAVVASDRSTGATLAGPAAMRAVDGHDGWYVADIAGANRQAAVLTFPGSGDGSAYELPVGAVIVAVDGGELTQGNPFPTVGAQPTTTLTVNFHAADDAQARATGIWAWGSGQDGTQLDGRYIPFAGQPITPNAAGDPKEYRVASATLDGDFRDLHFRIVDSETDTGTAVDGTQADYTATVMTAVPAVEGREDFLSGGQAIGAIEAWVDGADPTRVDQQSPGTLTPSPVPGPDDAKSPKTLDVTIHYHRGDGDYQTLDAASGRWEGWDVWTWATNSFNGAVPFVSQDDFGMVATWRFTQDTEGVRAANFIMRGGGSAWSEKDPDDGEAGRSPDRPIPESFITVDAIDQGRAEFWVVSGELDLYAYAVSVADVTFEDCDDDGTCTVLGSQAVHTGAAAAEPVAPVDEDGRTFLHWSATRDGSGGAYDFATPVTGRLRLYAQWAAPVTVSFDRNDGAGSGAGAGSSDGSDGAIVRVEVAKDGTLAAPTEPEREGYRFLGWSTARDGTPDFVFAGTPDATPTPVEASMTLYAQWERVTYQVTVDFGARFDVADVDCGAGGIGEADGDGTAGPGDAGVAAGAGADGNGAGAAGTADGMDTAGGAGSGMVSQCTVTVAHGDAADLPDVPAREGWQFLGWDVAGGGGGDAGNAGSGTGGAGDDVAGGDGSTGSASSAVVPYVVGAPVTGPLSLVARWAPADATVREVTFMDGERVMLTVRVEDGSAVGEPSPGPQRDGMLFAGWMAQADGDGQVPGAYDFARPVTQDLVLTASWRQGHTVTFDVGEGHPALEPADRSVVEVAEGAAVARPDYDPEPGTADGVWFAGWATRDASGVESFYDFARPVTQDLVLHAVWRSGPRWTIHFDLNGGSAPEGMEAAFADRYVFDGDRLLVPSLGLQGGLQPWDAGGTGTGGSGSAGASGSDGAGASGSDGAGASGNVSDGTGVMVEPVNPQCAGCSFQGWTTVKNDALGASVVRFDASGRSLMSITRNGVLYALWGPTAPAAGSGTSGSVADEGHGSGDCGAGSSAGTDSGNAQACGVGNGIGSGSGSGDAAAADDDPNATAEADGAIDHALASMTKFPSTSFGSVDRVPVVVKPRVPQ